MGSAWLGLLGALAGGLVSLTGTVLTMRFQGRQERARWDRQQAADAEKREIDRRRETLAWTRERDDDHFRRLREEKIKYHRETLEHLLTAGGLAAKLKPVGEDRRYAREDEMAIVDELRQSHGWLTSLGLVCTGDTAAKLDEVATDLYFTLQTVTYEGVKPGQLVRRPPGNALEEWLLSETIDTLATRISAILREDLTPGPGVVTSES